MIGYRILQGESADILIRVSEDDFCMPTYFTLCAMYNPSFI